MIPSAPVRCCEDPACSHALVAAATKEATHLTDKERETILGVLGRDELLRREQQHRVMHLKAELQNLRRKGALRPSADWDSTGPDPDRSCGRCRVELGRVINRGAYCRACRLKVCKGCREYSFKTTDWVCTVCHKHMEIQTASGEWMNEFVRRPSRRRDNRVYVPAADIIKRTIRRSWTISNPTVPRWSSQRGSVEFRPYNSLPRGQDITDYPSLTMYRRNSNQQTETKSVKFETPPAQETVNEPAKVRVNPLIKYANVGGGQSTSKTKSKRKKDKPDEGAKKLEEFLEKERGGVEAATAVEKRVSFDTEALKKSEADLDSEKSKSEQTGKSEHDDLMPTSILRANSLSSEQQSIKKLLPLRNSSCRGNFAANLTKKLDTPLKTDNDTGNNNSSNKSDDDNNAVGGVGGGNKIVVTAPSKTGNGGKDEPPSLHFAKGEEIIAPPVVELCDIEPLSGTVFRKVTVRRQRRHDNSNNTNSGAASVNRKLQAATVAPTAASIDTNNDDVNISEAHSSPMLASRSNNKSASPSPVAHSSRKTASGSSTQSNSQSTEWQAGNDEDIILDRLVGMQRTSLSSLGLRSDSMASVYSGAGEGRYGTVAVRGQVEFGLQYNYKAGALEIQIKQCRDLAPVDIKRNRSDPYVKVYLLPDKSKSGKRKTKVKKHTLNPVFDECLKFHISLNGLETRTLWLTVWHSDMFGRNDFLGEVMMTLENKVFDEPTPKWYNLQERTEPFDDMLSFKGDILVCLKFVPPDMTIPKKGKRSRGTLHVLVKEAKSLTAVKANGTSDPFCKSYLLPDKGRSSKQKTPVAKRTVNPIWNYTFIYDDVTLQELAERCLELTVWDHDRLASNEFLGGVRFSLGTGKHYGKSVDWMDATGKELSLWKSMLERPNFWVEGCLSLRPTLDLRQN